MYILHEKIVLKSEGSIIFEYFCFLTSDKFLLTTNK